MERYAKPPARRVIFRSVRARGHQPEQGQDSGRDPYIEQAIQQERDRQQAFEQGIDQDRENDLGFGIE